MSAEREARRALNRLRRAAEKCLREVDALEGALSAVEGEDFPAEVYREARERLEGVRELCDDEARRLQEKILQSGGLEPGRIRRTGGR